MSHAEAVQSTAVVPKPPEQGSYWDLFAYGGCVCARSKSKPSNLDLEPENDMLLGMPVKLAKAGLQGTVDGVAVVGGAATDLTMKGMHLTGDITKAGLDSTVSGLATAGHFTAELGRDLLLDPAETDLDKVYAADTELWRASPRSRRPGSTSCFPTSPLELHECGCACLADLIPGFAAVASVGSHAAVSEERAYAFADRTALDAEPASPLAMDIKSLLLLKRLRRQAASLTPLARDLTPFAGRWGIVSESGREAYLGALDLNFVVRRVALSMPTPPINFFVDEQVRACDCHLKPSLAFADRTLTVR